MQHCYHIAQSLLLPCALQQKYPADLLRTDAQWMKQIAKMLYITVIATLALVSYPTPSASQVDNTNLTLPARVIDVTGQVCPPDEVRVSERNKIAEDVQGLLHTTTATACQLFRTQSSSAVSCSTLPTCPSGYYWIRTSNGSAVRSTVTWTECVAAMALEGGHVLPTLT